MNKFIRRSAAALLAVSFLFCQPITALAEQDDSNSGPAFANQAPQDTGAQAGEQPQPGEQPQAGEQPLPGEQPQPGEQPADDQGGAVGQDPAVNQAAAAQAAAEQAAAAEEAARQAAIIANTPYLQIQVLKPDMTWTPPVVGDDFVQTDGAGFRSMGIYLNNIVGNVIYRTYSSANGWTQWAMNGDHTPLWEDGSLVEAFQIRFSGFVGNKFHVYYSSVLSDGSELGWTRSGGTSGAMAVGKYISSFRVSLWGKETEGEIPYNTERPLDSATTDGVSFGENGVAVFSSGTGAPYSGWGWNDRDRYYFVDNQAVTGWQYIDGYKYYFDETGKVVTDLEPLIGAQGPYLIRINKQMNTTTVYVQDGANGFIIPLKSFLCSTGEDTPTGSFKTPEKYRWRLMNSGVYCQYATRLGSGLSFLLHSIIYESPDVNTLKPETYNFLGVVRSAGCIRYLSSDAKWIFDHCPVGTTIEVYNSPVPGPYERPAIEQIISGDQHWDPSDPVAAAQHQQ